MKKHEGMTCSRYENNAKENMQKQCKHIRVCVQCLLVKEVVTGDQNSGKT